MTTMKSTGNPFESEPRAISSGTSMHDEPMYAPSSDHEKPEGVANAPDINFKSLSWWQCGMLMIAETVSLGILSLPSVLATIGMVPSIILLLSMGALSTYAGYLIGVFRHRYPNVTSFADAGHILFEPLGCARLGYELFAFAQLIFLIFIMGSHILTWTICMNTITNSPTCTIVWGVVGLVLFWVFGLPRTLENISWFSLSAFVSIISAVFITMIAVGIERPIGNGSLSATRTVSFVQAFGSVTNITFAFAGNVAFFGFIAELKDPKDWNKALALLQIFDITLYTVAAIVIYVYCGNDVASPALGSSSHTVKKIAWGVAIPTIIIAGVIYGHVASKYIFTRIFKDSPHSTKRTRLATISWYGITLAVWTLAWVIAESIPVFNNLLGLISALFASWFTYSIPGVMWLFMNKGRWFASPANIAATVTCVVLVIVGAVICVCGLWSSGVSISRAAVGSSWSCASNAQ